MLNNPDLMSLIADERQRELWQARAHRLPRPSLRVRLACRLRGVADALDSSAA